MAKIEVRLLEVGRNRIVYQRRYSSLLQKIHQCIACACPNHIEVPHVLGIGRIARKRQTAGTEGLGVCFRQVSTLLVPFVETRKLHTEECGLKLVQPGVVADLIIHITDVRAVIPECADLFGQCRVVRGDRTAVSESAQILGRIETEARGDPK
jgi:hypothetical protein